MSEHFADDLAKHLEDGCILCKKPTQSHVLMGKPVPEESTMVPGTVEELKQQLVIPFELCHTCYTEYEGDPHSILNTYVGELKESHAEVGMEFGEQLQTMMRMIDQDEYMLCPDCGWMASTDIPDNECLDCGGTMVVERGRDAQEGNEYRL